MIITRSSKPEYLRTQIAIIGSGPGGATAGCLLAEAGRDVIMLEEGPFLPQDSCPPFSRAEMEQKYRSGGITPALGKPAVTYVEGRCAGGGSEINSGLYHRTPTGILEEWRKEYRVEGLSEVELRPHFETIENDLSVSYLDVPAPPASLKLAEGAAAKDWHVIEAPRWFRSSPPEKQSMTRTYLPRMQQAGGQVIPSIRARSIRRSGGRWQVHAQRSSGSYVTIEADTVFVAGGAIQTPALLRRSGIKRNVGNNLRMHPTIKVVARFPDAVNVAGMGVPVHQVKEFAPRYSFGCSISAPMHLALALADHPQADGLVHEHWPNLAVYYAMIRGGQGSVRNVPFFRDPLVRFRLETEDMRDLALALKQLCRCLMAAGATHLYPSIAGSQCIENEADVERLPDILPARRTSLMTIHLFSTCPMGEDRSRCAADSFGKVYDMDGLYLADASLLCGPPGVNPQGSIMAVVRRNTMKFLGKL